MNKTTNHKIIILLLLLVLLTFLFLSSCGKNERQMEDSLEELRSLPYVAYSSEEVSKELHNVVVYNTEESWGGYNLYQNYTNNFFLMDMYGNIIHTWTIPLDQSFEYGHMLPTGELLAVGEFHRFVKVDWNSHLLFAKEGIYHHDIEVMDDDSILVLSAERRPYRHFDLVEFHTIEHYSPGGDLLDVWKTYDHLEELKKLHKPTIVELYNKETDYIYDYYHLNTIRAIPPNDLEKTDNRFREGNLLVCSRHTNLIFILDKETKDIVWSWGPDDLDWPHYPYMLKNGILLIFDNGYHRGYTRIIKLHPVTKEIVWEYKKIPETDFFTKIRGCAQPLPNGNLLITESEKSHVFEINENNETVWEYYEPGEKDGKRRAIYRMIRYPASIVNRLLAQKVD